MKNSKIAWTHHTFNPWIGCGKVSPGCANCYAEAQDKRWGHDRWGPDKPRTRTSAAYWRQPLAWNEAAKKAGVRQRVFCASLADVFDDAVEPGWRAALFRLIGQTPLLDWLLLTKRPKNILKLWPFAGSQGPSAREWPNVWLGTTVEDQARAEERIPLLVGVPAVMRFLSCEPLLGPLDLSRWLRTGFARPIDWVIIGGESGQKARPFHVGWARSLIHQCRDGRAGVVPFVKQLGAQARCDFYDEAAREVYETAGAEWPMPLEWREGDGQPRPHSSPVRFETRSRAGEDPLEWPEDLRVREFPETR